MCVVKRNVLYHSKCTIKKKTISYSSCLLRLLLNKHFQIKKNKKNCGEPRLVRVESKMHILGAECTSAQFHDSEIFEAPHCFVRTCSVVSCSNEDSESETDPELFQFLNTIAQERKQTRAHSLSSEDCRESYELDLDGHDLLESPTEDTVRGLLHSPGSPICRSHLRPVDKITKGFKVQSSQAQPRQTPSKSRHTNSENPATSSNVPTACWVGEHSTASLKIRAGDLQRPADGIVKMVSRTNGHGAALGAVAQVLAVWLLLLLAQYHVLESQRASR